MNDQLPTLELVRRALITPTEKNLLFASSSLTRIYNYTELRLQMSTIGLIIQQAISLITMEQNTPKEKIYKMQILSELCRIMPNLFFQQFDNTTIKNFDFDHYLSPANTEEVNDETINFFNFAVKYVPVSIASLFQKQLIFMLKYVQSKDVVMRVSTMHSFSVFTEKYVIRPFYTITPLIIEYLDDDNEQCRNYAERAYLNIMKFLPKTNDLVATMYKLINIFITSKSENVKQKVMKLILLLLKENINSLNEAFLSKLKEVFEAVKPYLKQNHIKYELNINSENELISTVLTSFNYLIQQYSQLTQSTVMFEIADQIIISCYPFNDNLRYLCENVWQQPHGSHAQEILNRFTSDLLRLNNIQTISHAIMHCNFGVELKNSPVISAIKYAFTSGPVSGISRPELGAFLNSFGDSDIGPSKVPNIKNPNDMKVIMNNKQFNEVDFLKCGTFDEILNVLKKYSEEDFDKTLIEKLRDKLMNLVMIVNPAAAPISSPFKDFDAMMKSKIKIQVTYDSYVLNFVGPFIDTFGSIELFINEKILGVDLDPLEKNLPNYKSEITSLVSAVAKQSNLKDYQEFEFVYMGTVYSSDDYINEAVINKLKKGESITTIKPAVRVIPKSKTERNPEKKSFLVNQTYRTLLEILEIIHRRYPNMEIKGNLSDRVSSILKEYPLATISNANFASEIVRVAPSLFPFKLKEYIFRMSEFGSLTAADYYLRLFDKQKPNSKTRMCFKNIEEAVKFTFGISRHKSLSLEYEIGDKVFSMQTLIAKYSREFFEANFEKSNFSEVFPNNADVAFELGLLCALAISTSAPLNFAPSPELLKAAAGEDIQDKEEIKEFLKGFSMIVSQESMGLFSEDELRILIAGDTECDFWKSFRDSTIKFEVNLESDLEEESESAAVRNVKTVFKEVLEGERKAEAVRAMCGSFGLPQGGFQALDPPLVITIANCDRVTFDAPMHRVTIPIDVTEEMIVNNLLFETN